VTSVNQITWIEEMQMHLVKFVLLSTKIIFLFSWLSWLDTLEFILYLLVVLTGNNMHMISRSRIKFEANIIICLREMLGMHSSIHYFEHTSFVV